MSAVSGRPPWPPRLLNRALAHRRLRREGSQATQQVPSVEAGPGP